MFLTFPFTKVINFIFIISVSLVGGLNENEGNVLVNSRPICDDSWDDSDASVVCRSLGYDSGIATSESAFGDVAENFIMDDVICNGDEGHIIQCPHSGSHNCDVYEGAGVRCVSDLEGKFYFN